MGCRRPAAPHGGSLTLENGATDPRDALVWKWSKGAATARADFGTPLVTTGYALCVYDAAVGVVVSASAPAGSSCAAPSSQPCWTESSSGFRYRASLPPDGRLDLKLRAGTDGNAKIVAKGKGSGLAMPDLSTLVPPLLVQLRNTDGACWEAVYGAPPRTQRPTKFADTAD